MNELLQKHGCANVFTIPEGLKELMADITREVLRDQPPKLFDYIANYLSVLLITREHGIMAVKILDDLCDCKPSVSEHLLQLGLEQHEATMLAQIIKEEVEGFEPVVGKEKVKETQIIKKILARVVLGEEMAAGVCQVARNAYRDYWYRKKLLEKELKVRSDEPWEIAAERTLALYKRTKPSFSELTRATQKIQAAYRGYHVRRNLLCHLKPKAKKLPKVALPGPPLDIADSREIDLGPVVKLKVRDENTAVMFDEVVGENLHINYDPMKTITHVEDVVEDVIPLTSMKSVTQAVSRKSVVKAAETPLEEPEPQPLKVPSQEQQRPRTVSVMPENIEHQPSRAVSQAAAVEASLHKISFAETPVEVFEDPVMYASTEPEVQEDIPAAAIDAAEADAPEVPEDIPEVPENIPEVPEDIPVSDTPGTEGEDSAPEASIPSSAPDTANTTDVEDAGDTAEEEGEE